MGDNRETTKGVPTRDFTDAGTERAFFKGIEAEFETGVHANYLAAGLLAPDDTAASVPEPDQD